MAVQFRLLVLACLVTTDLYFFHLIVDKLTTGTYNFVSFILDVAFDGLLTAATAESASGSAPLVALLIITQFSDHVKIRSISQLINAYLVFFCIVTF